MADRTTPEDEKDTPPQVPKPKGFFNPNTKNNTKNKYRQQALKNRLLTKAGKNPTAHQLHVMHEQHVEHEQNQFRKNMNSKNPYSK